MFNIFLTSPTQSVHLCFYFTMGNPSKSCQTGRTHPNRLHWGTVWSRASTRSGSCLECWCSWRCVGTGYPRCYTHQYLRRGKKERNINHRLHNCLLGAGGRLVDSGGENTTAPFWLRCGSDSRWQVLDDWRSRQVLPFRATVLVFTRT